MIIDLPSKPHWAGPFEGGITQSIISRFLTCPFQFFLYAYMGLEEQTPPEPNLIWGDTLHVGLEHRIRGHTLDESIKIMWEYQMKRYPTAPASFRYSTRNMLALYPINKLSHWGRITTEHPIKEKYTLGTYYRPANSSCRFDYYPEGIKTSVPFGINTTPVDAYGGETITFRGKVDMLSEDRTKFGDHKGKGKYAPSPEALKEELGQDLQMNAYAWFLGKVSEWMYDIIKCPEAMPRTPAKRVSENPEQWIDRIFHTHQDVQNGFPIKTCHGLWIRQVPFYQDVEEIEKYMRYTLEPLFHKIVDWWHHVTHPKFDPADPKWWGPMFYISPIRNFNPTTTFSYKCKYHSFLTGKTDISSLTKIKSYYPELTDEPANRQTRPV